MGQPILREPDHDLTFAESDNINAVFFRPGSDSVLVQLRAEAVDLWPLAVHYWPEYLGALVALITLLALLRCRWVLRRPQRAGEPYCRKCNYNLSGHAKQLETLVAPSAEPAAVVCPECGEDLTSRPPRRGRSMRLRLAPAITVMVVAVGLYLGLHVLGVGRTNSASMWLSFPSLRAEELRQRRQLAWLDSHKTSIDLVLEVDAVSGQTVRQVAAKRGSTFFPGAISPDGGLIALSGGMTSAIDLVSTETGRVRATFSFPHDPFNETHRTVAFAPDGETVYVAYREDGRDRLVRWHWPTGERTVVIDHPVYQRTGGGMSTPVIRKYALLNRPEGLRILAAPDFSEAYPTIGSYVRIYDDAGVELAHYPIEGGSPSATPVVTPDGRRAFIGVRPGAVEGIDLETGASLGRLGDRFGQVGRSAARLLSSDRLALSADGRLLASSAHTGVILLRDIEARAWVAELHHDPALIAPLLCFSPDGRWLAAVPFKDHAPPGGGRRFVRHLLIFDLTKLPPAGAPGPGDEAP